MRQSCVPCRSQRTYARQTHPISYQQAHSNGLHLPHWRRYIPRSNGKGDNLRTLNVDGLGEVVQRRLGPVVREPREHGVLVQIVERRETGAYG